MTRVQFRAAQSADYAQGAHLVMETLHQFGDYLFGFGDASRANQALQCFFRKPRNRFSYQFTEFAVVGAEIAGILVTFDRKEMKRSMAPTAFQMLNVYSPAEMGKFIKRMLPYRDEENIPPDELYIAHLAVSEKFRRQGIGMRLLAHAEEKAREKNLPKLSLLTEIENSPARALYGKFGLELTETIFLPDQEPFVGSAGDVRMVKILS